MISAAETMIQELEGEAQATRRLLERVPADRLTWKPHEKSMTLGQLALHVAVIPGSLTELSRQDGMDAATVDFTAGQPESTDAVLAAYDGSLAKAREHLAALDEESAGAPWTLTAGEREIFTVPRLAFLRTLAFNHWYHHRGQLTVYLRLLDVPLPATYGRSADESAFGG